MCKRGLNCLFQPVLIHIYKIEATLEKFGCWIDFIQLLTYLFQDVAFMDLETKYEDFVNVKGRVVNPLNIASNQKRQPRSGAIEPMWTVPKKEYIPVSDLKHLPSPTKNNCKFYIGCFFL